MQPTGAGPVQQPGSAHITGDKIMNRYNDLRVYYVDFPDLPAIYGCPKVWAENKADSIIEARALWGRMEGKECHRLPNGTRVYEKDPSTKYFENMITEARRLGIPATDMY